MILQHINRLQDVKEEIIEYFSSNRNNNKIYIGCGKALAAIKQFECYDIWFVAFEILVK